ncbi:MAG TPA: hypothetical protein VH143_32750 [Kofleriaceae bacterium]|nr:hypothetical protein [Kofleriaceae bacterium]
MRDALRAEDVIAAYGLRARKLGATYRLAECPGCGSKSSSWAIVINTRKGTWGHFGHGRNEGGACFGDLIDLVAACEGFARRTEWRRVLDRAAEIAGVQAVTDEQRAELHAQRIERERRAAAEERRADAERRERAAADWQALARRHHDGEAYLQGRGLDHALVAGDLVRFSHAGDICVRLHDLVDGELVTVQRRLIAPSDPSRKCHTPAGGTTRGTLCGRIQDIGADDTIVVEGVADTLTAIQLWPAATVLGAAGAGQLAAVVEAAAPAVRTNGGRLVLVPDDDDVGIRCAANAVIAARHAGLVLERTIELIDLGEHHDLNDAHRAGWEP